MKNRVLMVMGLLTLLISGCASDNNPTDDTTLIKKTTTRLESLIDAAHDRIDKAKTGKRRDEILADLSRSVADDKTITAAEIKREKERFERLNAKLHSGPERVYPDEKTSAFIFGVPAALDQALKLRAGSIP